MAPLLLVIDNYDSFTYNLIQMILPFGHRIEVRRNDAITVQDIEALQPAAILISPGPKDPEGAGISKQVVAAFHACIPILGVCLGMQCINEHFSGRTIRAPAPVHGKTDRIVHSGRGIFKDLPSPLTVARYHSLQAVPDPGSPLEIAASSPDDVVMALAHPRHPVAGVQFHPESFLTEQGRLIIKNFLTDFKAGR